MQKHNNVPSFVPHSAIDAEKSKREKEFIQWAQDKFRKEKLADELPTTPAVSPAPTQPAPGADDWRQAYQEEEELLAASQERAAVARERAALPDPFAVAQVTRGPMQWGVGARGKKMTPEEATAAYEEAQEVLERPGAEWAEPIYHTPLGVQALQQAVQAAGKGLEKKREFKEKQEKTAEDLYEPWMINQGGTLEATGRAIELQIVTALAAGEDTRELEGKRDRLRQYVQAKEFAEVGVLRGIETAKGVATAALEKQEEIKQTLTVPATAALVYAVQKVDPRDHEMERIADQYMAQGYGVLQSTTWASREVELPWGVQGAMELILAPENILPIFGFPGLATKPALVAFGTLGRTAWVKGATGGITRKFVQSMLTQAHPEDMARLMPKGTPLDIPNAERIIADFQGQINRHRGQLLSLPVVHRGARPLPLGPEQQKLEKSIQALKAYVNGMKEGVAKAGKGAEARRALGIPDVIVDLRTVTDELAALETKQARPILEGTGPGGKVERISENVVEQIVKRGMVPIVGWGRLRKLFLARSLQQQKAVDFADIALALFRARHLERIRTGVVGGIKRALRPGEAPFPVNKEGIWIGTTQAKEGAERSIPWQSVLEHPNAVLSDVERALRDDYLQVLKQVEEMRLRNGLTPRAGSAKGLKNKYYIPHRSMSEHGRGYAAKANPSLDRQYNSVSQGMAHGIEYSKDPMETLKFHILDAYQEIIEKQFDEMIGKHSIPPALIDKYVPELTKTRYFKAEKALADAVEAGDADAIAKATEELKRRQLNLDRQRRKVKYLPGSEFNQTENVPIRKWRDWFLKEEDLKRMKETLGIGPEGIGVASIEGGPISRGLGQVVNHTRFLQATMDFAMPFLQGLPLLVTRPLLWSKMTAKHYQAFFDPTVQARYFSDNLEVFQDMVRHGIPVGDVELFTAIREGQGISFLGNMVEKQFGKGMRETFRGIGKQSFGRFQASYDMGLATARAELWKSLSKGYGGPRAVWKGSKGELAQYIRNMTGGLDSKALGVGANQRHIEGMWLAFSPRYFRSTMALMTDAIRGLRPGANAAQRESTKTMASLVFGIGGFFALANIAIGRANNESWEEIWDRIQTSWNPLGGKKFLSLNINGEWIGVGGQVRSILQIVSKLAMSAGDPSVFLRRDPKANPLIYAWHSRGAPALHLAGGGVEALSALMGGKVDILPFDNIDTLPEVAAFAGTALSPFAAQAKMEGDSWFSTFLGGLGARTSTETVYDKRDQMAKELFNEGWWDTTPAQKSEFWKKHPGFREEIKQEDVIRCQQGDMGACDREAINIYQTEFLDEQAEDDRTFQQYLDPSFKSPALRRVKLKEWKNRRKTRRAELHVKIDEKRRDVEFPKGSDPLMDEYYERVDKAKEEHGGVLDPDAWHEIDQWLSRRTLVEQEHISRNSGLGERTELEQEYYRALGAIEAYWEVGETEAVLSKFATAADRAIARNYAKGTAAIREELLNSEDSHTRHMARRAMRQAKRAKARLRTEGIPGQHPALLDALLGRWYGNVPKHQPEQIKQALDQWLGGAGVRAVSPPLRGPAVPATATAPRGTAAPAPTARPLPPGFLDLMRTKYGYQG